MVEIGKRNDLKIVRSVDFGVYLDGENLGEILLPRRYVPENYKEGDSVNVFIYLDSEDRLVATTEIPLAIVGEFAFLKVVSVNSIGAFMDWGLQKDLLVPYREQKKRMEEGRRYIVYVYLDHESNRIVASAKIEKHLDNIPPVYQKGQEVNLLISDQTDIGYKAIINNAHSGILYKDEIFHPIHKGLKTKGFIKKVREDDKIDLSLEKEGYGRVTDFTPTLLEYLKRNNGFLSMNDKTSADNIYDLFGVSKKTFKKAIGALYRQKLISLSNDGIHLLS